MERERQEHLVAALVTLLLMGCAAAAQDVCADVNDSLQPCMIFMQSTLGDSKPTSQCCDGLHHIVDMEATVGVNTVCDCCHSVLSLQKLVHTKIDHSVQLQNLCGVDLQFNLDAGNIC